MDDPRDAEIRQLRYSLEQRDSDLRRVADVARQLEAERDAARRECAAWRAGCGGEAEPSCYDAVAAHDVACPGWADQIVDVADQIEKENSQ
jgi:hypothetical protein